MLRGRARERAEIDRLLARANGGEGGALVLRGEAGIGKSALLEHARSCADAGGMHVLRATGVEGESAMAYATLHQLLRPELERLPQLPEPQARALRQAFGLEAGDAPDRFLVSVAALTLLSDAAGERHVLCLVDDAHWADVSSAAALTFVARRLEAEPIAMLLALRDAPDLPPDTGGLPELRLGGLDPGDASALLDERWPGLGPAVRRGLVASCGGNPLALIETPHELSAAQLAGRTSLDDPAPPAARLEQALLQRVRTRDPAARWLLLVVAADGSGQLGAIRAAAELLGLEAMLLEAAQLTDLVTIDGAAVAFRHPLLRSAVYHDAGAVERREVHRALAHVAGESEPERRAWHLARAIEGPDAEVADELERSAARTLRRSGHAAASSALERAADLSPRETDRARRLAAAADAAWRGGDTGRASALLDAAERIGALDRTTRLDVRQLRGSIEMRAGSPEEGARLLTGTAAEAVELDPARAVPLLAAALCATYHAGDHASFARLVAISSRLPPSGQPIGDLLPRAAPDGGADLARLEELDEPVLLVLASDLALGLGDFELSRRLRRRAVTRARALGAAGSLAWALEDLTLEELSHGQLTLAEAYAQEGRRLALEAGYRNCACRHLAHLAQLAALRGHEEETRRLAGEVLSEAVPRQLGREAASAHAALGLLAVGAGRASEALDRLEPVWSPGALPRHDGVAVASTPDLVEAAVRAGRPERCRDRLEPYLTWAEESPSAGTRAVAARCRALLASDAEAERHFLEALRLHRGCERPVESARTELLYGEHLRRERRRLDARPHLRSALETFERLGLAGWAARAGAELRASGESARGPGPSAMERLSPQELQIVRAVAEGATNREIAAQLFISPRTVAYHLRNVFARLGISSRGELIRLAPPAP
jgi:DNA-binding CsgD family transcriptional regulator